MLKSFIVTSGNLSWREHHPPLRTRTRHLSVRARRIKIPLSPSEGVKKFGESVGQGYLQSFTIAVI